MLITQKGSLFSLLNYKPPVITSIGNNTTTTAATTQVVTLTSPISAGSTIIVLCSIRNATATATAADTRGNVYSVAVSDLTSANRPYIFHAMPCVALTTSDTITVTKTASSSSVTFVYLLDGNRKFLTSGNFRSGSTAAPTVTTNGTVNFMNAYAFAMTKGNTASGTITEPGGIFVNDFNGSIGVGNGTIDYGKILIPGPVTYAPTTSGTGDSASVIACYG